MSNDGDNTTGEKIIKIVEERLRREGIPLYVLQMPFYDVEEELQIKHYNVVGMPIVINGDVFISTSSREDVEEYYKYIRNN